MFQKVEFTCEICGNYVYMGRRNFERHFVSLFIPVFVS